MIRQQPAPGMPRSLPPCTRVRTTLTRSAGDFRTLRESEVLCTQGRNPTSVMQTTSGIDTGPVGQVSGGRSPYGHMTNHQMGSGFRAVSRVLKSLRARASALITGRPPSPQPGRAPYMRQISGRAAYVTTARQHRCLGAWFGGAARAAEGGAGKWRAKGRRGG